MRKLTAGILILIFSSSLLFGCSSKAGKPAAKFEPDKNTHLIMDKEEDLTGDSSKEKISLYVQEDENGMPLFYPLTVNDEEKTRLDNGEGYFTQANLKFEDLNGDQKKEVLFYRFSTGSAGGQGLTIYSPSEGDWQPLFSAGLYEDNSNRFEVKYLGNYTVSFNDKTTGLKTDFKLNPETYRGIEDMLENIGSWIDPVSEYYFEDQNQDGKKEVIAVQRVIGVSHPDVIAFLKTTYSIKNGIYFAETLSLHDFNDEVLAEVKL